ncbi:MAG: hypothetical protein ACE15C_10170 [Phycisphaerae bacterium]
MTQAPPAAPMQPLPPGVQPHRGTMILVFGLVGFFCCIIFAILAWVMGNGDLKKMAAGQMDRSGEGLTKAGKIIGMVACILAIVGLVFWIIMLIAGVGTFTWHIGS